MKDAYVPCLLSVGLVLSCAACPDNSAPRAETPAPSFDAGADNERPSATHAGLISIQDVRILNVPAAGHGLTITPLLNTAVAPDTEEIPGSLEGCRAYDYDINSKPPPPVLDLGKLYVGGIQGGEVSCGFAGPQGYACPTAGGDANVRVDIGGGLATYAVDQARFVEGDVGRYLRVAGAGAASNLGAFPILAVLSSTSVAVANPAAQSESFSGAYGVLAGVGPTPQDRYQPFRDGVQVSLELREDRVFAAPRVEVTPGDAFTLDPASEAILRDMPIDGQPVTLGCSTCGVAKATLIRIQTTDAEVANLSPIAFPPPARRSAEIVCLRSGSDRVTIPASVMSHLRKTNEASRITRIRSAFMRDGVNVSVARKPLPPNRLAFLVGRGVLGFSSPKP